jgi:hypothetical protein
MVVYLIPYRKTSHLGHYLAGEAEVNGIIGVPIVGRQNVTDVNTGA